MCVLCCVLLLVFFCGGGGGGGGGVCVLCCVVFCCWCFFVVVVVVLGGGCFCFVALRFDMLSTLCLQLENMNHFSCTRHRCCPTSAWRAMNKLSTQAGVTFEIGLYSVLAFCDVIPFSRFIPGPTCTRNTDLTSKNK